MTKKILIANDTQKSLNLGCQLVSNSIRNLADKYFPDYEKDYISAFKSFESKNWSEYSLVIINGEGSLGPRLKNTKRVLEAINCAYKSGVKCALINTSLFLQDYNDYSKITPYLKRCSAIYAREKYAHGNFLRCGVSSHLGVDIGIDYCLNKPVKKKKDNFMLVSGGSFFKKTDYKEKPFNSKYNSQFVYLFRLIRDKFKVNKVYLHSWPAQPNDDIDILSHIFKSEGCEILKSNSFEHYYSYTERAKVVFTGRHHGVVMAVGACTPVITYNSFLNKTYGDCLRYQVPDSYFDLDLNTKDWDDRIALLAKNRSDIMKSMHDNLDEYKNNIDVMFKHLASLAD